MVRQPLLAFHHSRHLLWVHVVGCCLLLLLARTAHFRLPLGLLCRDLFFFSHPTTKFEFCHCHCPLSLFIEPVHLRPPEGLLLYPRLRDEHSPSLTPLNMHPLPRLLNACTPHAPGPACLLLTTCAPPTPVLFRCQAVRYITSRCANKPGCVVVTISRSKNEFCLQTVVGPLAPSSDMVCGSK